MGVCHSNETQPVLENDTSRPLQKKESNLTLTVPGKFTRECYSVCSGIESVGLFTRHSTNPTITMMFGRCSESHQTEIPRSSVRSLADSWYHAQDSSFERISELSTGTLSKMASETYVPSIQEEPEAGCEALTFSRDRGFSFEEELAFSGSSL